MKNVSVIIPFAPSIRIIIASCLLTSDDDVSLLLFLVRSFSHFHNDNTYYTT